MRGRHGTAILEMVDIPETIVDTVNDFVSIAVRLANDPEERRTLGCRIADTKHRLYRDRACISALEELLERAAQRPAAAA